LIGSRKKERKKEKKRCNGGGSDNNNNSREKNTRKEHRRIDSNKDPDNEIKTKHKDKTVLRRMVMLHLVSHGRRIHFVHSSEGMIVGVSNRVDGGWARGTIEFELVGYEGLSLFVMIGFGR